jgi:hypothetical protein
MVYWDILFAAVASFVIGMTWYSPAVFGKQWMKLSGITKAQMKKSQKNKKKMMHSMIGSFIANVVMAYVLSVFAAFAGAVTFVSGLVVGFWLWLGLVATILIGSVFWEQKPWGLYFLNAAHWLVVVALMSGIVAAW